MVHPGQRPSCQEAVQSPQLGMLPLGMVPLGIHPLGCGVLPLGMLPLGMIPLGMVPLGTHQHGCGMLRHGCSKNNTRH